MLRLLLLLVIIIAIDIYAFQAVRTLIQSWNPPLRNLIYGIFWTVPVLAIGYFLLTNLSDFSATYKNLAVYLRTLLFIAYLSKLLLLPLLLIDDVRRLATMAFNGLNPEGNTLSRIDRSRFLTQVGLLLGSLPFISLTYGIIRNPYRYKVFRKEVEIEDLPEALDGLRIVQISDIHSGSFTFREPVKNAIDLINRENADLVLFTGDMVNSVAKEMEPFVGIFDKVRARHGVFSVLGNHDYGDYHHWPNPEAKAANLRQLESIQKRLGWQLLRNENRILEIEGHSVGVIGVENFSTHPRFPQYGDLDKAYRGAEGNFLKILLSHDPSHWQHEVVSKFRDIDLTFSGHTHGMQFGVEIPGWVRWSPIQYMYEEWAGLYRRGKQYLYVNRGLGFIGYPGRVGILPEITSLVLRKL